MADSKQVILDPLLMNRKEFQGFSHPKDTQFVLNSRRDKQFLPTQIHEIPNGSRDETPSFLIVGLDGMDNMAVLQMSLNMLNQGLSQIGYTLEKNK